MGPLRRSEDLFTRSQHIYRRRASNPGRVGNPTILEKEPSRNSPPVSTDQQREYFRDHRQRPVLTIELKLGKQLLADIIDGKYAPFQLPSFEQRSSSNSITIQEVRQFVERIPMRHHQHLIDGALACLTLKFKLVFKFVHDIYA